MVAKLLLHVRGHSSRERYIKHITRKTESRWNGYSIIRIFYGPPKVKGSFRVLQTKYQDGTLRKITEMFIKHAISYLRRKEYAIKNSFFTNNHRMRFKLLLTNDESHDFKELVTTVCSGFDRQETKSADFCLMRAAMSIWTI